MSRSAGVAVGAVALGALGAVAWAQLAQPSPWQVLSGRLVLTEEAARGDFRVALLFAAIGLVGGLVLGVVGQLSLRASIVGVALVAVASVLASVVAWRLGIVLGPPDPSSVAGLTDGDEVPSRLAVGSVVPFFAWPIGALVGVLLGTWVEPGSASDR